MSPASPCFLTAAPAVVRVGATASRGGTAMTRPMRAAIELAFSTLSAICCAATLAWPTWIETVFGIDPDAGSGSLEFTLTAATAAGAVAFAVLARHEWRRVTADAST
jgi:hypothetical protein